MIFLHHKLIIYRSKKDFKFGSFHVRTGGAWLDIYGRLKRSNKETLYARIIEGNGNGKSVEDKTTNETEISCERDRLIQFLKEPL